jgi:hypothetical protein
MHSKTTTDSHAGAPATHTPGDAGRAHLGNMALSISALVLTLVVLTVAGRGLLPVAHASAASEVAQSGDYTALTCDGGNEDILVVLDGRSEQLFVYKVLNQTSVQLYQREDVSRLFSDARARARGTP